MEKIKENIKNKPAGYLFLPAGII